MRCHYFDSIDTLESVMLLFLEGTLAVVYDTKVKSNSCFISAARYLCGTLIDSMQLSFFCFLGMFMRWAVHKIVYKVFCEVYDWILDGTYITYILTIDVWMELVG